jgi:hypothetical protein
MLGAVFQAQGKLQDAINSYEMVINISPDCKTLKGHPLCLAALS